MRELFFSLFKGTIWEIEYFEMISKSRYGRFFTINTTLDPLLEMVELRLKAIKHKV